MKIQSVDIRNSASAEYAHLDIYTLDESKEMPSSRIRPMVIICPGGAYAWTSKREGEPIAMKFLAEGIHAAVLWYSVKPYAFPTSITEVAQSVYHIRTHAEELHVDMNRIYVMGFSAGGHLAASYGCFWNCDFLRSELKLTDERAGWLKPDGLILSYPVITSGEKTHAESIANVMGSDDRVLNTDAAAEIVSRLQANLDREPSSPAAQAEKSLSFDRLFSTGVDRDTFRAALALENQVTADTPPCFIWHTQTDGAVPVENSLYFVNALQAHCINYELHIYPMGGHGVSLANDLTDTGDGNGNYPVIQHWITDACRWVKER